MIEYNCPECGVTLQIPEQFAGQRGKCTKCGSAISVPSSQIESPEPSPTVSLEASLRRFRMKISKRWVVTSVLLLIVVVQTFIVVFSTSEAPRQNDTENFSLSIGSPESAPLSNRELPSDKTISSDRVAASDSTVSSRTDRSNARFTAFEHSIYREFMNAPMSQSEDEVRRRLGRKYGKSASDIESLVDKMLKAEFSVDTDDVKKKVQAAITSDVNLRDVIVAGSFANVSFIETSAAWNDSSVRRTILKRMPEVLGQILRVDSIQRVRLTAYYPSTSGEPMKVASFEALRSDYRNGKTPEQYNKFWVRQ